MEKKLFRNSRESMTNRNLRLPDEWLIPMLDSSNGNLWPVNFTPTSKLIVKPADSHSDDECKSENICKRRIRILNLPESMIGSSVKRLVQQFGLVEKVHVVRSQKKAEFKETFAYVTFRYGRDATKAMQLLDGYKHNHLVFKVEWAQPPKIE